MITLIVLVSLVVITNFWLILSWILLVKEKKDISNHSDDQPFVSILIAARNEQESIGHCLKSLIHQDYPTDKFEILVGDDHSEDETALQAKEALKDFPNSKVITITKFLAHQKGKANVLAQLAHQAAGEYFLITDADMELPTTWISGMVKSYGQQTGIVTGVTLPKNNINQRIDWLFALAMVYLLFKLKRPVTTMGNNMLITKRAYWAVGGYEGIPFSITEDLELFQQVYKAGFAVEQKFTPQIMGETQPIYGYFNLLHQRKRWISGVVKLPFSIVILLFIQAAYFPLLLLLVFINWPTATILFLSKTFLQAVFIKLAAAKLNQHFTIWQLLRYEFYSWLVALGSSIFFLLPTPIIWKGRKY